MKRILPFLLSAAVFLFVTSSGKAAAQSLQMTYGFNGVQTLAYSGTLLEDMSVHPEDSFHIWHMKATDLQGNVLNGGQYGWGEVNSGRSWDSSSQTWTYLFSWGSIKTQFQQAGDTLNVIVTETNNPDSGIIFDGATIYPFALHFPQQPNGFSGGNAFSDNTSGPSVVVADYGSGQAVAVAPDASKPLYSGYQPTGAANAYTAMISSTVPDSLATFMPHHDRPVLPGQTDTFLVSLRFTPSGTSTASIASDVYQSWTATYPPQVQWNDRRIIGTVYLASSPGGPADQPGGYPNNPRRYFNDSNSTDFDVTNAAGLTKFQARVLQQAQNNVQNLQRLNAQGAITWDIEGEQYPQATSYVCSPDQIAQVAPEMESVISDASSPYAGMKLDDAYFHIMQSAGFRIGVCIRPQQFTLNADGTAGQTYLSATDIPAQLIRKMKYAHDRWGATIFYVDTTVDTIGGTLDAGIFQQVQAALPDSLIIPEEAMPRDFAYTAPFASFLFHTDLGTDPSIHNYYPHAFSANLINDVDPNKLAQYQTQLIDSVRRGDILMVHADYWQDNNPTVVSMYQAAGITAPTPVPTAPSITWAAPASIAYGTALSPAQLNATANVPGAFAYNPALGTVLHAGKTTLSAVFIPSDSTDYTTATMSVNLTVKQASPALAWPTPASIAYGTTLNATQLNATADVPGTFAYSPSAGTTPALGNNTLSVIFTPDDATDYAVVSTNVQLMVSPPPTPKVAWSTPAPITYGSGLSLEQLNATADVPGSFTYSPSFGTILKAGTATLSVIFTPTDNTYKSVTSSVPLTINPAIPVLSWSTPASITYGTALSGSQLNATATVPGTFTYAPSAGTVLAAGDNLLTVMFQPQDATDYASAMATVHLNVASSASPLKWNVPDGITYGTPLSAAQLNATASVAGTLTYSPGQGTVLSAGTHTLTATFTPIDTKNYASTTASVSLAVSQSVSLISWSSPPAIVYGTPLSATQLNAVSSTPGTFSYSTNAGSVLSAGSHTLTATFTPDDQTDYTSASASVTLLVNQGIPTLAWSVPPAITYGTPLSAMQLNAAATLPGTFTYTPAMGALLPAGSTTLAVTFTPQDPNYTPASATVVLLVNQARPIISWNTPLPLTYGAALTEAQLNATADVTGTFTYYPALGSVLTTGTHLLTAAFIPADTKNNAAATTTVILTVLQSIPAITWAAPATMTYGTALSAAQLNASTNVPGSFTYTPAPGVVPAAGPVTLTTTFTPADPINYSSATATVNMVVGKATPALTWPVPNLINYGTALSVAQLNALSSVPGAFVYTPAAGALPAAGVQKLSATFMPTDTADFNMETVTVNLLVAKLDTSLALSASASTIAAGSPVVLTAQASAVLHNGLSGVVSFMAGNTLLGASLLSTSGTATLSLSNLPVGSSTIVAVYGGDPNFNGSQSDPISVLTGAADYTMSASANSAAISAGQRAQFVFTVTPVFGFQNQVSFECSGLPANTTCTFSPAVVTPNGQPAASTLLIATNTMHAQMAGSLKGQLTVMVTAALWLLPFALRRRTGLRRLRSLPALLALVVCLVFVSGCGSSDLSNLALTPSGTYAVTVIGSAATSSGTTSHSAVLNLTISNPLSM